MSDLPDKVKTKSLSKFSLESSLSEGWQCTKREFWPMIGVLTVAGILPTTLAIITFLLSFTSHSDFQSYILWSLCCGFVSLIVNAFVEMGLLNVQLKVVHGEHARVSDLFSRRGVIINFLAGSFLYGLIKFFGLLFFIIPGLYVMVSLPFYSYFIVDKEMGPIQALKASWVATRGARLDYALTLIVFHFVKVLGSMVFLVGAIPANMVTMFGTAHIYRQLLSRSPVSEFEAMEIGGLNAYDNGPVNAAPLEEQFSSEALHEAEVRRFDEELKKQNGQVHDDKQSEVG